MKVLITDPLAKVPIYVTTRTKQHLETIHKCIFAGEGIELSDHGDFVYILCCNYLTRLGLDKVKKKKKK
tara:strand:+ start:608 stop:814 length:207 start_codon:yes stop_codon:yes gene_type:complete